MRSSDDCKRIRRRDLLKSGAAGIVALGFGGVPWQPRAAEAAASLPDGALAGLKPGHERLSMITLDEVLDFAGRWFDTVMNGGSAADQAAFFLDPRSRIYVLENGATFGFEEHFRLHAQWINEVHALGQFTLTPLNASPERVRAMGTVYWQAEFAGRPAPNVIKAVVGEDWIVERKPSGELAFVLYMNTFHHTLPDSAPLDL